MTPPPKPFGKCFCCGRPGHIAHDCRKKKVDKEKHDIRDGRMGIKYAEAEQIAVNCPKKIDKPEGGGYQVDIVMVPIPQTTSVMTTRSWKSNERILDSFCLKQMSNNRSHCLTLWSPRELYRSTKMRSFRLSV